MVIVYTYVLALIID
jgi:hypothetical protein